MGKASSSKKVQRAARAAASSRGASERRELGFPLVIGMVIILGIGLVLVARGSRDPLLPPTTGDHWHAAYTVYECGNELPAFQGTADPDGIHTHGSGLMHIHPFNSSATGADATLAVFFDALDVSVTPEGITASEFAPVEASTGCGDEQSVIKAARWLVDGDDGLELVEVFDDDFGAIRFLADREAFTIARVAVGDDPPPPSAASLAQLDQSTGGPRLSEGPVTHQDAATTTLAPVDDGDDPGEETDAPTDGEGDPEDDDAE